MRNLLAIALATLVALPAVAQMREGVPELVPGIPMGYLTDDERLDSAALLPSPPASGSAAAAADAQMHDRAATLRGSPRWDLAIRDASLAPGDLLATFDCALGAAVTPEATPRLYQLMQRVSVDTGYSTEGAKKHHQALRPFVVYGETN